MKATVTAVRGAIYEFRGLFIFIGVFLLSFWLQSALLPLTRIIPVVKVTASSAVDTDATGLVDTGIESAHAQGQDRDWISADEAPRVRLYFDQKYYVTRMYVADARTAGYLASEYEVHIEDGSGEALLFRSSAAGIAGARFIDIAKADRIAGGSIRIDVLSAGAKGSGFGEVTVYGEPVRRASFNARLALSLIMAVLSIFIYPKIRAVHLLPAGLILLSVYISMSPLTSHAGWPDSHEHMLWKTRLCVYIEALRNSVVYPMWWKQDLWNLGSPMPALYHKTFNYLAALFYLVTLSMKHSAAWALMAILAAGAFGIYALSLELGAGVFIAACMAVAFPHSNYVFTDWLVRGAYAEMAAFALVPWLFLWCARLLMKKEFSYGIALIIPAMFYSHSLIAYLGAMFAAAAYVAALAAGPCDRIGLIRRAALSLLAVMFLLALPLSHAAALWGNYAVNTFSSGGFAVSNNLDPIARYFYDGLHGWDSADVRVQLDGWIMIYCILSAAAVLFLDRSKAGARLLKRTGLGAAASGAGQNSVHEEHPGLLPRNHALAGLGLVIVFTLFMQTRLALPIYALVPGLRMMQFPWRMLSYSTVALYGLAAISGAALSRRSPVAGVVISFMAAAAMLVPSLSGIGKHRYYYAAAEFETLRLNMGFVWAEFVPRLFDNSGNELTNIQGNLYIFERLALEAPESVDGGHCEVERQEGSEYLLASYNVRCDSESVLVLPVNYSGLETVRVRMDASVSELKPFRTPSDPRARVSVPKGGYVLDLKLPGISI